MSILHQPAPVVKLIFDSRNVNVGRVEQFGSRLFFTPAPGSGLAPYVAERRPEGPTTPVDERPIDGAPIPAGVVRACLVNGRERSEPFRRTADGWRGERTGKMVPSLTMVRAFQDGRLAILSSPAAEADIDQLLRRAHDDEPTAEDRQWFAKLPSNQRSYEVAGEPAPGPNGTEWRSPRPNADRSRPGRERNHDAARWHAHRVQVERESRMRREHANA